MPDEKRNGHDYGGDEELTPADPGRIRVSAESRVLANLGLEHSHASECMWRFARLYDASRGDDRDALLAKVVVELSAIAEATLKARAALVMEQRKASK